jgi:hypothetical protein
MDYCNLHVEYDKIIIFDFLSPRERSIYKLSEDIKDYFANMPGLVVVHKLSGKVQLFKILNNILSDAQNGQNFFFNIIAHGNKKCISFKHLEVRIYWTELAEILSKINHATENTLVLNMTTCFGLHGIKMIEDLPKDNVIFGLVGYSQKIKFVVAKALNKLFYKYLKSGIEINEIIKKVRMESKDTKYHCLTSQGYKALKKEKNK